jgi:hypothetical protein
MNKAIVSLTASLVQEDKEAALLAALRIFATPFGSLDKEVVHLPALAEAMRAASGDPLEAQRRMQGILNVAASDGGDCQDASFARVVVESRDFGRGHLYGESVVRAEVVTPTSGTVIALEGDAVSITFGRDGSYGRAGEVLSAWQADPLWREWRMTVKTAAEPWVNLHARASDMEGHFARDAA